MSVSFIKAKHKVKLVVQKVREKKDILAKVIKNPNQKGFSFPSS